MRALVFWLGVIVFLFCMQPLKAQDMDRAMLLSEGFYAYERHDFATARDLWTQIEAVYGPQSYLFYNLARVYEYLGDWGPSRLYDLRAKSFNENAFFMRVAPDIQAALDRGWARQEIETLHPLIWLKRTLYDLTRPIGWGLAGALLWAGVWIMVVVYIRRGVGRSILVGLVSGLLLWFMVVGINVILTSSLREAVSLETTPVYSGPGRDYVSLTTWAEGYDLYILQTRGEWVQVMRADGEMGWGEQRVIQEISIIPTK